MGPRPVVEIGDGLNVAWATFARGPYAHNFDPVLRGLAQSLGHLGPIVIAIHHRHVRAYEAKGSAIDYESAVAGLHKSRPAAVGPVRNRQQNCRARNQHERGP
jgi:hypothetical protein